MDAEHSESRVAASAPRAPRRIWCETLPYGVLGSARVLGLLRRFELRPLVAVRPWDLRALPELVARAAGEGVPLGLWPMLSDAEGRWLSEATAGPFAALCERALDAAGDAASRGARPPVELALDLEPPIQLTRALLGSDAPCGGGRDARILRLASLQRAGRRRAGGGVRDLAARLAARMAEGGGCLSAAIVPLLLLDAQPGSGEPGRLGRGAAWQALLGTPIDDLPVSHASAMLYTTLAGYARPFLRRREALELLVHFARLASARFGARAGLSLGAVGPGALGDEPVYERPAELAEDVALAEASGVGALSLLDLGGVIARPPAEAWLEAFCAGAAYDSRLFRDLGGQKPGEALDAPTGVGRSGFGRGVRSAPAIRRGWRSEVVLRALRTVDPVTRWLAD